MAVMFSRSPASQGIARFSGRPATARSGRYGALRFAEQRARDRVSKRVVRAFPSGLRVTDWVRVRSAMRHGRETINIELGRPESHIQYGRAALNARMFHASAKPLWARRDFNGDFCVGKRRGAHRIGRLY